MSTLSLTQKYFLCTLDEKGNIPNFNSQKQVFAPEKRVCLVASSLLELQLKDCIKIDSKTVTISSPLPEEMSYLKPLYDYLNSLAPIKIKKILNNYNLSITRKRMHELISSIGDSLVKHNAASLLVTPPL